MKKQVKTLSLKTDKVVSLNSASLANVMGGFPPTTLKPSNSGQSYNCIKAPSNSGQSYNC
ncbi:MAG: class I lanthipeptide [Spirosomataceae bacterium]